MIDNSRKGSASAGPFFDRMASLTQLATGAVLVALVILIGGEAFLRAVANFSLGFAEEFTGYFVVMLTFFGAALAVRSGALFQVHFLFDKYPVATRIWLQRLFVITALIVCVIVAWKSGDLVRSSFDRGKFAPTVVRTPLWIPQLLIPAGFALIGVFLVEQLLLAGRKFRTDLSDTEFDAE